MMQPIRDQVLVKPFMIEGQTENGIIIPDSFKKESNKVKIVAVGNGTAKSKMKLQAGQIGFRVKDWKGNEVQIEGETYYLMNQDSILATT
jgi:co-chaperonin GroES (HSP10)